MPTRSGRVRALGVIGLTGLGVMGLPAVAHADEAPTATSSASASGEPATDPSTEPATEATTAAPSATTSEPAPSSTAPSVTPSETTATPVQTAPVDSPSTSTSASTSAPAPSTAAPSSSSTAPGTGPVLGPPSGTPTPTSFGPPQTPFTPASDGDSEHTKASERPGSGHSSSSWTSTSTGASSSSAGGLGAASASPSSTSGVLGGLTERHVDTATPADAPSQVMLAQGSGAHRAGGPVDVVQLLASSVAPDTGQVVPAQLADSLVAAPSLGDLVPGTDLSGDQAALPSMAALASSTGAPSGSDALLLATTVGAALALAGTAWEGARRQRARAAAARGHGRRARR